MARFIRWLRSNADGFFALVIALTVGLLGVLDVLNSNQVDPAILLILALLATTLLRDRLSASRALVDASSVRLLHGHEVSQAHARARRDTELWAFKGGTGTYLRAVTLRECVRNARRDKGTLRVRVEIIDPTNESLAQQYAQFRSSLTPGPDRTGELWTLERTRKESFATVLAACWYRQRFAFLDINVGLSQVMTTFRWDLSSNCVIMTQEDPNSPALMFEKGRPHYRAYNRELAASFQQARPVPIERAADLALSDEPTVDEARRLFTKLDLGLPSSFTDRDITDIIRKAIQPKNPYW
ncbi:MAG TPA: hypothetical protein VG317_15955 [Pseudonocardiaceae bacterium]|jgi:hypothetical protein|nr:hypothetical protein [Pseudonocardiaceae bacterium]